MIFYIDIDIEIDPKINKYYATANEVIIQMKKVIKQMKGGSNGGDLFQGPDSKEVGHWYIEER